MTSQLHDQKFLIIGGCGNFGYRVVRWLVEELDIPAEQVSVIDLIAPATARNIPNVAYHQVDITDAYAVARSISKIKPEVIIHTASPPYHANNLEIFMRGNVQGTRNLLDAAVAESSVKVFVYTSSSSVVHDTAQDLVEADETWPLLFMPQQRQPYHHSKATAEKLALSYNRKREDFVVCAIRPSGIFGPDDRSTAQGIVERARSGGLRVQIGDGTNEADFTYTDNIVHAHVLAVEKLLDALEAGPQGMSQDIRVEGEAFTITNDEHPKFWDFARQMGAAAGYPTDPSRIITIPKIVGLNIASIVEWFVWLTSFGKNQASVRRQDLNYSTITRTFNIDKAQKRLGYRPLFSLQQGIELSVAPFLKDGKKHA